MSKLLESMQLEKKTKTPFIIYFDIETLTYNKNEGRKKPSLYKNVVYSVAIGVSIDNKVYVERFPTWYHFFEKFFEYQSRKDTIGKTKIVTLIAHNTNKYDSHFLLHDLVYFYDIDRKNQYLKNAVDNKNCFTKEEFKKNENIIFEKRVKSSINLDMNFTLNNTRFNVVDNYMKTHSSIATLGEKLLKLGVIDKDKLKTDFKYDEFDLDEDMTEAESYEYAISVFNNLNEEQLTYIDNDIYILGYSHLYYSEIYPGFDYSEITFTRNILLSYLKNELTKFQLLNDFRGEKIKYTDFKFFGMNFFDFIKLFYRGGLNFYNDAYIGKVINVKMFSMDLNSSYPYTMHKENIPTYLKKYNEGEKNLDLDLDNEKEFALFIMLKTDFNIDILSKIESKIIKQILVKYYHSANEYVAINTNTIRMINKVCHINITSVLTQSYVIYECVPFASRDEIAKNYFIKSQGKQEHKIIMPNPYEYTITEEINTDVYTQEEIDISKVKMNGLYGIPALRSHFNLFRMSENDNDELVNTVNGYANNERNLLFSTFVTSKSLYNLLEPLSYLTQQEIDDNFIYADTDSLYLKQDVFDKMPSELFDKITLGKWDIETFDVQKFYVLNHKKYAYLTKDNEIKIKCGGVNKEAFNTNMSFDDFIDSQFSEGATIKNTKSIYTKQHNIAIYESETELQQGGKYPIMFNPNTDKQIKELKERVRNEYDNSMSEDYLYVESELGSFSLADLNPVTNSLDNTQELIILKQMHNIIKNTLN